MIYSTSGYLLHCMLPYASTRRVAGGAILLLSVAATIHPLVVDRNGPRLAADRMARVKTPEARCERLK